MQPVENRSQSLKKKNKASEQENIKMYDARQFSWNSFKKIIWNYTLKECTTYLKLFTQNNLHQDII